MERSLYWSSYRIFFFSKENGLKVSYQKYGFEEDFVDNLLNKEMDKYS